MKKIIIVLLLALIPSLDALANISTTYDNEIARFMGSKTYDSLYQACNSNDEKIILITSEITVDRDTDCSNNTVLVNDGGIISVNSSTLTLGDFDGGNNLIELNNTGNLKATKAGSHLSNLYVIANSANHTGDCLQIMNVGISLHTASINTCGGWGIRIGRDALPYTNNNFWRLDTISLGTNTLGGLYIHDPNPIGPNVNAGTATHIQASNNKGPGLKFGYAMLNTVIGYQGEGNATGISIDAPIEGLNTIIGGDIEANTISAITTTTGSLKNLILLSNISGAVIDNGKNDIFMNLTHSYQRTYDPISYGLSTTGSGSYATQTGNYTAYGKDITFRISLAWSGHNGTGQLAVSLPFNADNSQDFIPVNVFSSGITVPAGSSLKGLIYGGAGNRIQFYSVKDEVFTAINIPASGTLWISGNYKGETY